jgi:transposase
MGIRTRYSAEFKAKVALEAIRGDLTLAELAKKHGIHPNVVGQWKRLAIENMATAFGSGAAEACKERDAEVEKLHAKIGQLVVERDFLSKAFGR